MNAITRDELAGCAPSVWVRGGGVAAFRLESGQSAMVTDAEGMQTALMHVVDLAPDAPPLLPDPSPIISLAEMLASTTPEAASVRAALPDLALARTVGYALLRADGPPGQSVTMHATSPVLCVIQAPGSPMAPSDQHPPTGLDIRVTPNASDRAPPPLAATKLDQRIAAATAGAYRVAAGDYIQIIDISGKQCSDFLAFDAAALDEGREFGIDPTATRTMTGNTTPGPGLHAKFFDARLRPLVEIVRDTVGRHDAFMLACTARYYEDLGYPGHANCSDNFNRVLAPLGVAARAGWPAINFFYNTFVRADGSIGLDEPWSRPGDYVLLRALTDLVCASSSCADDVDPANGWQPTDIQVRVYDQSCAFSKGIAHRMTPDAEPELTRETGFHPRTAPLTRSMQEYRGFWLPGSFAANGPIDEYWACRERAAVIDLSALRKFEVTGPDAEALLQYAVTRDIRRLAVGQVVYTAICHPHGGMMDDATIFRLGAQAFRFVCGDPFCGVWLRRLAAERGLKAWVKSSTDQLHNLAVQGPRSRAILGPLVRTPPAQPSLDELGWFRFLIGRVDGRPVVISRTGYTGELGYEIWCHPTDAPGVWDAVWQAGLPLGIAPMGLAALDMVRIEAGLVFAGAEFCDQTDPFEAGIGFTVPAKKADDFVGGAALIRRRQHPQRLLVGLDVEGHDDVAHGDPVFVGRAQVGVVTSATRSPILRRTIALARLDTTAASLGAAVEIGRLDGHQKRLTAAVTRSPHYDPEKTRVRA